MGKIKLNLVSGAIVEKPLINAFKANNNSYVVLDNEMNGSMGLPIILVCKFENNKLTKIIDQNEWQIVKEYLKNIIAGNHVEFINIENEIAADDIYYTQLTLPVPSFDALKQAYKVETSEPEVNIMNANIENNVSVEPVVDTASTINEPVIPEAQTISVEPVINNPDVSVQPVAPTIEPVVSAVNEINVSTDVPTVNVGIDLPTNPIMNTEVVQPTVETAVSVEPEISVTPVIESAPVASESAVDMFKEQKEAFMLACENMFDALVQKFEKELENKNKAE